MIQHWFSLSSKLNKPGYVLGMLVTEVLLEWEIFANLTAIASLNDCANFFPLMMVFSHWFAWLSHILEAGGEAWQWFRRRYRGVGHFSTQKNAQYLNPGQHGSQSQHEINTGHKAQCEYLKMKTSSSCGCFTAFWLFLKKALGYSRGPVSRRMTLAALLSDNQKINRRSARWNEGKNSEVCDHSTQVGPSKPPVSGIVWIFD